MTILVVFLGLACCYLAFHYSRLLIKFYKLVSDLAKAEIDMDEVEKKARAFDENQSMWQAVRTLRK